MAGNISISLLSIELDMTVRAVLDLCEKLGVPIKSGRSVTSEAYADMIRRRAEREGLIGESAQLKRSPDAHSQATKRPSRKASLRSLRFLHLQKYITINGRDAFSSRQLLTHMRSENHNTMVRAFVQQPTMTDPAIRADFLTPEHFLADPPDVITSEGSLLSLGADKLRIDKDLLRHYLMSGGVVIVDGVGVHNDSYGPRGEPSETYESAWAALRSIVRFNFLDGRSPDHLGVRLRNDGDGLSGHPQIAGYAPDSATHADWLAPAYRNISKTLILNVRPLFPTGDLLGTIDEQSFPLDLGVDLEYDLTGPFPWGVVHQVGAGFIVLIAGIMMADVVVDMNPDNAIFLQQLAELLVGEAEREKILRGFSIEAPQIESEPMMENTKQIRALIAAGEGRRVEFKSSARHDMRTGEKNRALEGEIARQVVAMWNTDGGDLLVGVADDGTLVGIEVDHPYVDGRSNDGWIRFIEDLLIDRAAETVNAANPVRVTTHKIDGLTIGQLSIPRGERAAYYLAPADQKGVRRSSSFLVRDNNRIRELDIREIAQFISDRFA
jgi:hypothetical protein